MIYNLKNPYSKREPECIEINPVDFEDFSDCNKSSAVILPFPAQRVSCGLFGIANDHVENYQSLDERFIKNKASTYFFEAESDSMSPLIMEGDVLIVDRALDIFSGRIVVCSLNGEMLCKRLRVENNKRLLCSENLAYSPIEIHQDSDFSVFGVVRGIAREFHANQKKKEPSFG